jgi:hypothetical protein
MELWIYQPQQSVLYRHDGHRQTACIRNISAPQRSHRTLSSPGVKRHVDEMGTGVDGTRGPTVVLTGGVGSDIAGDYKLCPSAAV